MEKQYNTEKIVKKTGGFRGKKLKMRGIQLKGGDWFEGKSGVRESMGK